MPTARDQISVRNQLRRSVSSIQFPIRPAVATSFPCHRGCVESGVLESFRRCLLSISVACPRRLLRGVPMGLWGLPSLPGRRSNYRYFGRVDRARYHSPYGSPARSVSRTSRRTRASTPCAISSALGTHGLSPLRSRAPRRERLLL